MSQPAPFYAVLVGATDYSVYDRASGLAAGSSDLRGPLSDVREWGALVRRLGSDRSDVRVLATVPDTDGRDRGRHTRPPTRANILAACGWLRERLVGEPEARGLLVFACHGAVDAEGQPVLCPTDMLPDGRGGVSGTLRFVDLERVLTAGGRNINLTAILDTCHAAGRGVSASTDRLRSIRKGKLAANATRFQDHFPVFNAARADQPSYEVPVGEDWRGAFSWAALRVIQRWGISTSPTGVSAVSISHRELNDRVKLLLSAMGFDQEPQYTGPGPEQALFASRKADSRAFAAAGPRTLSGRELWPDTYDLHDARGQSLGTVHVTGANAAAPWESETVYWSFNGPNALGTLDVFELKAGAPAPASPASADLVHPNAAFVATTAGAVPMTATTWYSWTRTAPGRPSVVTGHLGVAPGGPTRAWTLTWVSTPELAGTLARLSVGETFHFQKLPGAPVWQASAAVALAIDVAG